MTTYPLDKPSYFLFQDSASEVSYANDNYEYEQNGKFQFWLKYTYCFFLLDTY